jgi:outer membrane protein assembly factor BamB
MRGVMKLWTGIAVLGVLALSACGQRDTRLQGERLDLRTPLDGSQAAAAGAPVAPAQVAFATPPVVANTDWTHRAGSVDNAPIHPQLNTGPRLIWSVRIGDGEGKRKRISADPVVAGGRIFTLDSENTVAAVSTEGRLLWTKNLIPEFEKGDDTIGGGLATNGELVIATSGFGRITALNAISGDILWEQRIDASASTAPALADGIVYAVGSDSRAWAIEAETGRIVWTVSSTPSPSGLLGGAAPAVTDRLVLLPFPSSEIAAVLRRSGLRVWAAPISGQRPGRVYARLTDVTGDPVVVGDRSYAGNPSGRTIAINTLSGERIWSADEGATSPVQVFAGSVFLMSDQNELVRLDAETGTRIWGTALPYFTRERPRRRRTIFDHYGPVLAGGQLIVASGDDLLRFYSPATGAPIGQARLPGGGTSLPAVAGGTLYVVSGSGQLHAYR